MPKGEAAVEFREVSLATPAGDPILERVSWRVERGATASVIGASGSGKSSLLRLINRLDDASSGDVEVLGRPVSAWNPRELRRRAIWLPQSPQLGDGSPQEILAVPARLGLISEQHLRRCLEDALELAHFDRALLGRDTARLSGGERQRLALARALLLEPELLLLDEPTSSLDGETATKILAALQDWRTRTGATLIVVTHRISDLRRLGGSVLMLDHGRVRHRGDAQQILASPAGDDIRKILAGEDAA